MSSTSVLEHVMAFKSVHVLNDIVIERSTKKSKNKATHYCCVLISGRNPLGGVWTIGGKFVRYAGSREQINEAYPNKTWTRVMSSWMLSRDENDYKDIDKRVRALEDLYGKEIHRDEEEKPHGRKKQQPSSARVAEIVH